MSWQSIQNPWFSLSDQLNKIPGDTISSSQLQQMLGQQKNNKYYRSKKISMVELAHLLGVNNSNKIELYLNNTYGTDSWNRCISEDAYEIREIVDPKDIEIIQHLEYGLMYDPSGKSKKTITTTSKLSDLLPKESKSAIIPKKEKKFMGPIKEYFTKHREIFFTFAVVFLVDHFLFHGKFKEKIQNAVEGLLDKSIKTLHGGSDEK
jgi:hypothetical protein